MNKTNHPSKINDSNPCVLVWLDTNVNNTEENQLVQKKLENVIHNFKAFDEEEQFKQYLSSVSSNKRIILIISGGYGRKLIPEIHNRSQISSMYVYCMDKAANEQWAKNYKKIKGVFVRSNDLINQIETDQNICEETSNEPFFQMFSSNHMPDQTTTDLNGHFVHFLLLIDVLIRLKSSDKDRKQFLRECRMKYENDSNELQQLIQKFENEYTPDKAIEWYCSESCLYEVLNESLRKLNIDLLFLFRFYIHDIYHQLKELQWQEKVRVYRGQRMSKKELDLLRQSVGQLISINVLFSTSLDKGVALGFMNRSKKNNLCKILFIIDADPTRFKSKPFAYIQSKSQFMEEEILFMIGCIFRITSVENNPNENYWIVKMNLCDDNENELRETFLNMKKDYGGGDDEIDLHSYGIVLHQMGKYDSAEKIYLHLIDENPRDETLRSDLYCSLAVVLSDKCDYDSSIEWLNRSLQLVSQIDSTNYINITNLKNLIGENYRKKGDNKSALKWYNDAIEHFRKANENEHIQLSVIYNNVAIVHYNERNFDMAIKYYEKCDNIQKKHYLADHPQRGKCLNNIGCVYLAQKKYDLAMGNFQQALKIRTRTLPPFHPDIAESYKNIGTVHVEKNELKQALAQYEKANKIYGVAFSSDNPNVIEIQECIRNILLHS